MFRCSVDGQVSRSFSHGIIGEKNVFAAATCTDSIVVKMRRKTAIVLLKLVHVRTSCVQIATNSVT